MIIRLHYDPFNIFIEKDIVRNEGVSLTLSSGHDNKYLLETNYTHGEKIVDEFNSLWEALDSLTHIVKTLTKEGP